MRNPWASFRVFSPRGRAALSGMLAILLLFSVVVSVPGGATPRSRQRLLQLPSTELTQEEAILHVLNRLSFGPRPGEVERVREMGLEKWIEQQLAPEALDDSALRARLERFPTLAMSATQLLNEFPPPQVAARRMGLTQEEYRKRMEETARQRGMQGERRPGASGEPPMPGDPEMRPMRMEDVRAPQRVIAELSMAKLTRAIYSERQLEELMVDFWFNHFNVFAGKGADRWLLTSYERDSIRPHALGKFRDLLFATAESPAMLFYLDNWMSADPKAFERMERELAERRQRFSGIFGGRDPLAMGRRAPLGGQRRPQQRPDMQGQPGQPQRPPQGNPRRGLNENYARELLELHTLGVDGGYTQQDVIEVARAFTGWTLRAPRVNPEFYFDSRIHDSGPKTVLGKKIAAGGMRDAEQVLEMLSKHPSTAKFISTKLARRFVADTPPAALVERMSKAFLATEGDIRAVLRTMIESPEFWSREAYRAKIKKPFELVASAVRAVGGDVEVPLPLVQWVARIGEPLYQCQPPTGYADTADAWVNTNALLNRMNFALALAGNRLRGTRADLRSVFGAEGDDPAELLDRALTAFLAGQVSPATRAVLEKQMSDPEMLRMQLQAQIDRVDARVIAGLVLGAPEFQRR